MPFIKLADSGPNITFSMAQCRQCTLFEDMMEDGYLGEYDLVPLPAFITRAAFRKVYEFTEYHTGNPFSVSGKKTDPLVTRVGRWDAKFFESGYTNAPLLVAADYVGCKSIINLFSIRTAGAANNRDRVDFMALLGVDEEEFTPEQERLMQEDESWLMKVGEFIA